MSGISPDCCCSPIECTECMPAITLEFAHISNCECEDCEQLADAWELPLVSESNDGCVWELEHAICQVWGEQPSHIRAQLCMNTPTQGQATFDVHISLTTGSWATFQLVFDHEGNNPRDVGILGDVPILHWTDEPFTCIWGTSTSAGTFIQTRCEHLGWATSP